MNKLNGINIFWKILIIFVALILIFGYFSNSELEPYASKSVDGFSDWLNYYRELKCEFSLFEITKSYIFEHEITLRNEPSGDIECFGKNFYIDYIREQKVEDGFDKFSPSKVILRISTNLHLDLIFQSAIWLIIFSFIPKNKSNEFKINRWTIFLSLALLYLHTYGEKEFYKTLSRDFSHLFFFREYNNSLVFSNYYLYTYLLSIFIMFYFLKNILESRAYNLVNYFPYLFLFYGTFASLNLNFFVIVLSFLGINKLLVSKPNFKFSIFYLFFFIIWMFNLENIDSNFDVDKIRGFANTSQTYFSLIFWSLVFYLVAIGTYYLVEISIDSIDLKLITNNLLITSSFLIFFGILSSLNQVFNFLSFYVFGLNKTGMNSITGVEGNAWRGLAPSAEGIGEFYAFVILFSVISFIVSNFDFKTHHYIMIFITLYGLYRANNAAAIISLTILLIITIIHKNILDKKLKTLVYLILIAILLIGAYSLLNNYSFEFLSGAIMYESVQASNIDYEFNLNQYNLSAAEEANYAFLLNLPKDQTNFSSSLQYLLNSYTYGNKIQNIPSVLSSISAASYFINRSEKWGIFISKYNPDVYELLFGYGPNQFPEYFLGHNNIYQDGLILPHSSILSYLLFFGIIGLGVLFVVVGKFILVNKDNFYGIILLMFFLINFIKSDSLIYFPNLVLISILFNLIRFRLISKD